MESSPNITTPVRLASPSRKGTMCARMGLSTTCSVTTSARRASSPSRMGISSRRRNIKPAHRVLRKGEVRHQSGPSLTEYGYTGQYSYTGSFGLMYYNARWYDPSLGRFAQADSIVPPGVQVGWNSTKMDNLSDVHLLFTITYSLFPFLPPNKDQGLQIFHILRRVFSKGFSYPFQIRLVCPAQHPGNIRPILCALGVHF